eukprot:TRINITY_DN26787_c0_g1_i1.p1 TRINITY_DN26787_c0_g1~~TRINITY_DN26787_c0_g1_i1.p1  ORF type:complete len:714 (+),score=230.27 TRINITY_DN26787_c0_g1_i1:54-2195(+)
MLRYGLRRACLRAVQARTCKDEAKEEIDQRQQDAFDRLQALKMRDRLENVMSRVSYSHGAERQFDYDAAGLMEQVFDYVVVGSGYGGSTAAMRLAQKGYSVLVVEEGRRGVLADSAVDAPNLLWAPRAGCTGPNRYDRLGPFYLRSAVCAGGASYSGHSDMAAPDAATFEAGSWKGVITEAGLRPHLEVAKQMLGVVASPFRTEADRAVYEATVAAGVADAMQPPDIAVFLGSQEGKAVAAEQRPKSRRNPYQDVLLADQRAKSRRTKVQEMSVGQDADYLGLRGPAIWRDPYFGGVGPARSPCVSCAGCLAGCRFNAKNTLSRNYLFFAEHRFGAVVMCDARADLLRHAEGDSQDVRYHLDVSVYPEVDRYRFSPFKGLISPTRRALSPQKVGLRARNVVVAAGARGTAELLLRSAADDDGLAGLRGSPTLGKGVRVPRCVTHAFTHKGDESTQWPPLPPKDYAHGLSTSAVLRLPRSRVEVVRVPTGSAPLRFGFAVPSVSGVLGWLRSAVQRWWADPSDAMNHALRADWPENTLLLHQYYGTDETWDLSLGSSGLVAESAGGSPDPDSSALEAVSRVEAELERAFGSPPCAPVSEAVLQRPVASEAVGGACVGSSRETAVAGPDHQVFGHPGLYVMGSAAISGCMRGRSPALTAVAMAERAVSMIPDSGSGPRKVHLHDRTPWQEIEAKDSTPSVLDDSALRPASNQSGQ